MEWPHNKVEKPTPKVVLHFLRHSIKETAPEKSDLDIKLSESGRDLAAEKYENPLNMRFAHVAGSTRIRTHETAAVAATQNTEAGVEDLGVGKLRIKEELDFNVDETGEYGKRFNKEYAEGALMTFLVHTSDTFAKENGDTNSSTYSRMAANIARTVYRNFEVASRGASILEQSEHPENEINDFERILVTHATIQESFLLKVVEKIQGIAARDNLLTLIGENGFGYTEGFDVTLSKENGDEQIRIVYKKGDYVFDEVIPLVVIKEIIDEGE